MVNDMSLWTFIRTTVVMSAEVDIHIPILELFPGQGQWMATAVAEKQSPK